MIRPIQGLQCDMSSCFVKHWKKRSAIDVGHRGAGSSHTAKWVMDNCSGSTFGTMSPLTFYLALSRHHRIRENTIASFKSAAKHVGHRTNIIHWLWAQIRHWRDVLVGCCLRGVWCPPLQGCCPHHLPRPHMLYIHQDGKMEVLRFFHLITSWKLEQFQFLVFLFYRKMTRLRSLSRSRSRTWLSISCSFWR